MQKIIRVDKTIIVLFEDGTYLQRNDCDIELFNKLKEASDEGEIYKLINPQYQEVIDEHNKISSIINAIEKSSLLTQRRDSIYWEDVSQLSMPIELVEAVLKAEEDNNEVLIDTYKNFWTLMSLNPDEECRKNLFWFLNRNGLQLSKHGFFVAYRNVDTTNEPEVFTDHHSHTFRIKIGEMVTLDRKECDCDSSRECSSGLHLASKHWLNKNYYGTIGLVCLCNPADVVAVPYNSQYGKLRTCAYLPIEKLEYGDDDYPIPYDKEDGFDCSYVTKVIYEGLMGTEEDSTYKIKYPEIPGINKENISDKLLDIAMKAIIDRQV